MSSLAELGDYGRYWRPEQMSSSSVQKEKWVVKQGSQKTSYTTDDQKQVDDDNAAAVKQGSRIQIKCIAAGKIMWLLGEVIKVYQSSKIKQGSRLKHTIRLQDHARTQIKTRLHRVYWRYEIQATELDMGTPKASLVTMDAAASMGATEQMSRAVGRVRSKPDPLERFRQNVPDAFIESSLEAVPRYGWGDITLRREGLVNLIMGVLAHRKRKNPSICVLGPKGCGKTILMQLLTNRLLSLKDEANPILPAGPIYYFNNYVDVDNIEEQRFDRLNSEMKEQRTMAYILVDKCTEWSYLATYLMKMGLWNLCVIGAGVSLPDNSTAGYHETLRASDLMLTMTDLQEVTGYFVDILRTSAGPVIECGASTGVTTEYTAYSGIPSSGYETVDQILQWLLWFTGGYVYPLLRLAHYLFSEQPQACLDSTYVTIITAGWFRKNSIWIEIVSKVFTQHVRDEALRVIRKQTLDAVTVVRQAGYWYDSKFTSNLLLSMVLSKDEEHQTINSMNSVDELFWHGFSLMSQSDWQHVTSYSPSTEKLNLMSLKLALNISTVKIATISSLHRMNMSDPVRTRAELIGVSDRKAQRDEEHEQHQQQHRKQLNGQVSEKKAELPDTKAQKPGHPPTTDFFINGHFNVYVDVVKNSDKLETYFNRFLAGEYVLPHGTDYIILDVIHSNRLALPTWSTTAMAKLRLKQDPGEEENVRRPHSLVHMTDEQRAFYIENVANKHYTYIVDIKKLYKGGVELVM